MLDLHSTGGGTVSPPSVYGSLSRCLQHYGIGVIAHTPSVLFTYRAMGARKAHLFLCRSNMIISRVTSQQAQAHSFQGYTIYIHKHGGFLVSAVFCFVLFHLSYNKRLNNVQSMSVPVQHVGDNVIQAEPAWNRWRCVLCFYVLCFVCLRFLGSSVVLLIALRCCELHRGACCVLPSCSPSHRRAYCVSFYGIET